MGCAIIQQGFDSEWNPVYCCGTPISGGNDVICPEHSDHGPNPFTIEDGSAIPGRGLLANVSSLAKISSNSTSSSSVPDSATSCATCHDTAIGAGVGVPLGVLALSFLLWALLERRWNRNRAQVPATVPVPVGGGPQKVNPVAELDSSHQAQELDAGNP
ncbi:hypothetical protein PHISP_08299 [Aspergillus sp. HF37]|nr:hypothetical protein PHISP_08299 [Aspergillus sp. HF37]